MPALPPAESVVRAASSHAPSLIRRSSDHEPPRPAVVAAPSSASALAGDGALRVMVVDDSAVYRALVGRALSEVPGIKVVAAAADGREALDKASQLKPDVVILDVEMPGMDGVTLLRELKARLPATRAIMLSSRTQRGARTTIDALLAGAADYVPKPAQVSDSAEGVRILRHELSARLQALSRRPGMTPVAAAAPGLVRRPGPRSTTARTPATLLVVGASTGGPAALSALLSQIRAPAPVPIVIVQHMPPDYIGPLASSLRATHHDVAEAREGEVLQRGMVRIAGGTRHLTVERRGASYVLRPDDGPAECFCKPAVNVLFRSAAQAAGPELLACVLTGMGSDGADGAQAIVRRQGAVVVQDEASAVVWGMAGAVAKAGLADAVLPLAELGVELTRRLALPVAGGVARS